MRHRRSNKKLNKPTDQRIALLRSLAYALFANQKIKTTTTRAREVSRYVARIVALIKRGDLASYRQALALFPHRKVLSKEVKAIAIACESRNGGFTSIVPLAKRKGDNADMSLIQFSS